MPDDDKIHQLPPALGAFPLYSVAGYSAQLPEKIVHDGGIFLPMWQREALWLGLESSSHRTYALRCSVGRINAVSGQVMTREKQIIRQVDQEQDYVVVPGQDWIDGICVVPGIVRQFVAMPLGSGYTVEGQKTGEEKHGGLQIEIIPSFELNLRTWLRDNNAPIDAFNWQNHRLDENATAAELGLVVGDKIRLYPADPVEQIACTMSDIMGAAAHKDEILMTSIYTNHIRPNISEYSRHLRLDCADGDESWHDAARGYPLAEGIDFGRTSRLARYSTGLSRADSFGGIDAGSQLGCTSGVAPAFESDDVYDTKGPRGYDIELTLMTGIEQPIYDIRDGHDVVGSLERPRKPEKQRAPEIVTKNPKLWALRQEAN